MRQWVVVDLKSGTVLWFGDASGFEDAQERFEAEHPEYSDLKLLCVPSEALLEGIEADFAPALEN